MARHILTLFILLATLSACRRAVSSADGFDVDIYTPSYAQGFVISGADGAESTIITVSNPWQGADSTTMQLFISRNGEQPPAGFTGQVIKDSARRIVTMSSTHIAMLDAIGEVDAIKGVSGLDFVSNDWINAHRDSIADVGFEGNVDYELILSLDPDIVLLYGVNNASPMEAKLRSLGIPYMYVGDYVEESPLGKAEWMVALGEITGKRREAIDRFNPIAARYNELAERVSESEDAAPQVMLNMPYGDSWFMPPVSNYIVRLISDAGGSYVYPQNNSGQSQPIDIEEAYRLVSKSDVWLNVGTATTLDDIARACPKFTDTPVFVNGAVYNNNRRTSPRGGNDFFESAVVNPDLVLRDLISIFHPELASDSLTYYQKIVKKNP